MSVKSKKPKINLSVVESILAVHFGNAPKIPLNHKGNQKTRRVTPVDPK